MRRKMYISKRDLKKFKPLSHINRVHVTPTGVIDDIVPADVLKSYHSVIDTLEASDSESQSQ